MTQPKQKPSSRFNRWGFFILFITPVFIALLWLIAQSGLVILGIETSLLLLIASFLYLLLGVLILAPNSPIERISRNRLTPGEFIPPTTSGRKRIFTDEIDILVDSMLKMQKNLKEKNAELVESREKMQELARTTLRAQEAERRYISRELHDQAGQLLVSLRYTVKALLSDLPPNHEPGQTSPPQEHDLANRLNSMLIQIDKTLETVREISHKMRPALLDVGDINLAMHEYCNEFQEGKKLHIEYMGSPLPYIAEDTAIAFFRFLQEALTNVLKHAEASQVRVQLIYHAGWVQMTVQDNGRGEAVIDQNGIGILGMKERFLLLGGTVEACAGQAGFTITAKAPL